MVAISPQVEKFSRAMVKKHRLTFDILGDPGNAVAKKYGLVWEVGADLREVYTKFGIDIDRFNGEERWRLPMPARYVIDTDSVIRLAEVNPDHTIRPEPAETVEFLRNMAKR
jgi:peroxiredoxin